MSRRRMPNSMVIRRPFMSASYSPTLFDEGKWSLTMYLMWTPRVDLPTAPPDPEVMALEEDPTAQSDPPDD